MIHGGPIHPVLTALLKVTLIGLLIQTTSLFGEAEIMQFLGKPRDYVLKIWGPPHATAQTDTREILTYPQGRIFLSDGIVNEVGASLPSTTPAGKLPRYTQPARPSTPHVAPTAVQPTNQAAPARIAPPAPTPAPPASPAPSPPRAMSPATPRVTHVQPSPYDEPVSPVASVVKSLLKLAGFLLLVGTLLVAIKIWGEKRIARRYPRDSSTGVFPESNSARPPPPPTAPTYAKREPSSPPRSHIDARLLDELDWLLFEDLTAEFFRQEGMRADLSRMGADGGVDIYLHRPGDLRPFAYVQCKAWGSRQVGVEPMRALYGVMAAAGIKEGYFVCIGEFSADARAFADANNIRMITGELFIARFNRFPEPDRVRILTRILNGDYTTPSCAKCGTKMIVKTLSDRENWCCPRYPKCRPAPIPVRKKKG